MSFIGGDRRETTILFQHILSIIFVSKTINSLHLKTHFLQTPKTRPYPPNKFPAHYFLNPDGSLIVQVKIIIIIPIVIIITNNKNNHVTRPIFNMCNSELDNKS